MENRFKLAHLQARHAAVRAVMEAPVGWVVKISEEKRNLNQNAKLHKLLSDISQTHTWCGEHLDTEEWKRLFTAAWMRATNRPVKMVRAIDGCGADVLYKRTSQLKRSECSELIEYINAWIADNE